MIRAVVAASALALLAACGPTTESPAESEAEAEMEAPAEEPQGLALTAEGWGPLRIGMTRAEVEAALGPDANPEAVGGPDPEACDEFRPEQAPEGLLVMIENGVLTRISAVRDSELNTNQGYGIGDPADGIKAAYGDDARVEPHKYVAAPAEYITVWATEEADGYVQNPEARGVVYEIGEEGTVTAIRGGGPSIQYVEGCS